MVRFATLCDRCQRRSEEYTAWPTCKECLEHICDRCDVASARTEDEHNETLCRNCQPCEHGEFPDECSKCRKQDALEDKGEFEGEVADDFARFGC